MNERKPVILCIDDDPDFLDSLRTILEGEGFQMIAASSAEEGRRLYAQSRPDMVLVDLMMEEVDAGATLVRDLRAMGPTPPILMLSSVGDGLHLSADATQLGLDGVLQKPVNPRLLVSTLRAKIHSRRGNP